MQVRCRYGAGTVQITVPRCIGYSFVAAGAGVAFAVARDSQDCMFLRILGRNAYYDDDDNDGDDDEDDDNDVDDEDDDEDDDDDDDNHDDDASNAGKQRR